MTNSILEVKNLTTKLHIQKQYYTVVNELNFSLYPGKTVALVGESGCGKSMTALALMGILPNPPALPPTGKVLYHGENLLTMSEKKMRKLRGAKIAMIFQDPTSALNPVYTIGDQLTEVAEIHLNLHGEEAEKLATQALGEVGIPSPEKRLNDYPHQLSGGMRQRVMIAMALLCEPEILIADEPTTALDVTIQAQVLDLIKALQKERGMALLLITHDMGVVAEMADDVIVMYASEQVETGSVHQVFDDMTHPYTLGLFRSKPTHDNQQLHPIPGTVPALTNYPKGCHFHPRCDYCMEKCKNGTIATFSVKKKHQAKCLLWDGTCESKQHLEEMNKEKRRYVNTTP